MERNDHFLAQMLEATQLLKTSGPLAATAAIQKALQGASSASAPYTGTTDSSRVPRVHGLGALLDTSVADAAAADKAEAEPLPTAGILGRFRKPFWQNKKVIPVRSPFAEVVDAPVDVEGKGKFLAASCTNDAGTRAYRVYIPSSFTGQALPLIVMLHGCKQNPVDFAAGTGMNAIAEKNNCIVVYPAQALAANGSNCWNWFKTDHQQRDRGEPSLIADITRDVIRTYHVDPRRVYVAGLSAGGAMAAIMGASYPEVYAAVGIHSGLPVGAAHNLTSAFAAMKNGMPPTEAGEARRKPMPVIVFHGDGDLTVHPRNGDQALAQCIAHNGSKVTVEKGTAPGGRTYTRAVQHSRNGKPVAEQWVVHGAGHAWSGGSSHGSYTDPQGPDASQEMLRFFFAQ